MALTKGWRRVLRQQRVRQRQARRLQPGRNLHPVDQRKAQTIDINTRDMERADFSFELDFLVTPTRCDYWLNFATEDALSSHLGIY